MSFIRVSVIVPLRRYSTEVSMISKEVRFSTVTKHTLTLPSSKNFDEVFSSIAFPSVDFNLWCRFYRSTPIDHVIAKVRSQICSYLRFHISNIKCIDFIYVFTFFCRLSYLLVELVL